MSHAFVPTIPPLTYRSQPFDRMGLLQPSNDTPWEIEPRRAGRVSACPLDQTSPLSPRLRNRDLMPLASNHPSYCTEKGDLT